MRIIIAGSRDITSYEVVRQAVISSGYWKEFGRSIEVVCGMARGVDLLGKEFAERNGLVVHEFPADWKTHGKAAGHIRNAEMGKFALEGNGRLLAVWDGKSRGTMNMIDWARINGLNGYIYRPDKLARYAQVGMKVRTDFSDKWTEHTITAIDYGKSQSGVMFQVTPTVPKTNDHYAWIDADWFELM